MIGKILLLLAQTRKRVRLLKFEVDYLISQAEKTVKVTNDSESTDVVSSVETCEQEVRCLDRHFNSVHVQTLPVKYFGRSQSTQTRESYKTMVTKGTQTCITNDLLSNYLSKPKMVSNCSQTDPVNMVIVNMVMDHVEKANSDESEEKGERVSITQTALEDIEQSANESDGEESCGDESFSEGYSTASGEESEIEGCSEIDKELDNEQIILTSGKSVKDQLKFIICEGSIAWYIATTFGMCLKCGSCCSVLITSIIGSYYKILISCSSSAEHNISWSTGPLMNRLPAFNLLIAATVVS